MGSAPMPSAFTGDASLLHASSLLLGFGALAAVLV